MCFALAMPQRGRFSRTQAGSAPPMVTTIARALPLGVTAAAPLAAPGGAVLITLADRETPVPGEQTGTYGALADETLS